MFLPKLNEAKPQNISNSVLAVKREAILCQSLINYLFKNKIKQPQNPRMHFNERQKELPAQN